MDMNDLNEYIGCLIYECKSAFRDRLLYMGLQGSYLRGEASEDSDIDIMVILDRFSLRDMDTYRSILKTVGNFDKSCGFICGREEMRRWNPLEVCQLLHTTKDLVGSLADYLPAASEKDEINFLKLSLGNLYHEICHRYIHADRAKNISCFRGTCKGLFFLLQNLRYLETGRFAATKVGLMELSDEEDRRVLKLAELPDGFDFDQALSTLFAWMQRAFVRIDAVNERLGEGRGEKIEIITTERLFLREMTELDYDALYDVLADSDIMKHYPYTFDETRVRKWIAVNRERYQTFGFGLWAVCLKKTGEMIGDCGLTMQMIHGVVQPEIGYHIRRDKQRKGYAKEAAAAVRDWAFRHTPSERLYSYMAGSNEASRATARATGMRLLEEYTDEANGITAVYAITRRDWSHDESSDRNKQTDRLCRFSGADGTADRSRNR